MFWKDAFAFRLILSSRVLWRVLVFVTWAVMVYTLNRMLVHVDIGIEVAPYEVLGGALGIVLVLRTNAGYDRWWEARRLWGAITNQTRNLTVVALSYGPQDPRWRERIVLWTAAWPHIIRHSLRGERIMPRVELLLGMDDYTKVAAAEHMPTYAALRIAELLRDATENFSMDRFAFLQADQARVQITDSFGGCERILKSPLPFPYVIIIRQFLVVFLVALPFALLPRVDYLTPFVTFLVTYPLLALDDIGSELQNPFDLRNGGHLPLDWICVSLERNLLALMGLTKDTWDELDGLMSTRS